MDLKEARFRKRLTQYDLVKLIAAHFGVSPVAICKRIKKLADKLPESY